MKKAAFSLTLAFAGIGFLGCSAETAELDGKKNDTVFICDTVYLEEKSAISDDFYFSINSIYAGNCWEKENDGDYWYYYRILFTSIEEQDYIYIEEIKIIADSKVKLIKRTKIQPQLFGIESFGLDSFHYKPELIEWISPTVVKLLIEKKEYKLDISKMKIVK